MTEQECLAKMVAPGTHRPGKFRGGVIQIHITRACDKSCFGCTQGSNLAGKPTFITPDQFADACDSLKGYSGVVGVFGGNPAMHPQFERLCEVMRTRVPIEQRGLWCNNPLTLEKARAMRETFNPAVSNLNCHLDKDAYALFKQGWPESMPFGVDKDSRHSPTLVAMQDVLKKSCPECSGNGGWYTATNEDIYLSQDEAAGATEWTRCPLCEGVTQVIDEGRIYELTSNCDINQHWSAMIGVFRGQLRAWFCEIAGAQSILHQDNPDYPDTGIPITPLAQIPEENRRALRALAIEEVPGLVFSGHFPTNEPAVQPWWKLPMQAFASQVRKHCFECGVPLRRKGELAMAEDGTEEYTATHEDIFKPKRKGRKVSLVLVDAGEHVAQTTRYLQNA
jgi:hypothetical protein